MAGAGKSITAATFIKKYEAHFKFVLMVRTRSLVFQLEEDLKLLNLDYSIFMAGEKQDFSKRIVLCSKDTIDSRNTLPFLGEDDVILIVDEADQNAEFQQEMVEAYKTMSKRFFFFGMTATAYKRSGLPQFDTYIEPITPTELRDRGRLVDFEYIIPELVDFSDVSVEKGEWNAGQVKEKLNTPAKIKAQFRAWQEFGEDRQTLIFCSGVEHSKAVVNYINSYYGKEVAAHCDAETPKEEREDVKRKFRNGILKFISNVLLFTRGTNIIEIGCIWDSAATLDENNHIQKLGRGSRDNPIYSNCLVLDFANNCINNGDFYLERKPILKPQKNRTKSELEVTKMRQCVKCFRASRTSDFGTKNICPKCGHENKKIAKKKLSKAQENKLKMQKATPEQILQVKVINQFKKDLWKLKNTGKKYRNDIAMRKLHFKYLDKYGAEFILKIQRSIWLNKYQKNYFEWKRLRGK